MSDDRPVHEVKSWPRFFNSILSGDKTHDLRRATDRDYRVGDVMRLREYDPVTRKFTGRSLDVRITDKTSFEQACALSDEGLHQDFCILSIRVVRS